MLCRCREVDEFRGDNAIAYAEEHLMEVDAQPGGQWLYRCAETGVDWIYGFVSEWDTGHGGRARLRRIKFRQPL